MSYDSSHYIPKHRPLDPEGIEFMTNHEVAGITGQTSNPKTAAYSEIPQYVEFKGQRDHPKYGKQDVTSVWYRLADIVNHLHKESGPDVPHEQKSAHQIVKAGQHAHYSALLNAHRERIAGLKAQGINVGNFENQPDPENKNIHLRMFPLPAGRAQIMPSGTLHGESNAGENLGYAANLDLPMRNAGINRTPTGEFDLSPKPSRVKRRS